MALKVYTARVSYHGGDRLDVTRKSAPPEGIIFAPSDGLLWPYIEKRRAGALTDQDHAEYKKSYLAEMRASYHANTDAWKALLAKGEVTLCCYCREPDHCHRTILGRDVLAKLGAEFCGERVKMEPEPEPEPEKKQLELPPANGNGAAFQARSAAVGPVPVGLMATSTPEPKSLGDDAAVLSGSACGAVLHGDMRELLRQLPDASIDSCVCDPPYGLSKEPDVAEVMRHWIAGDEYEHASRGFVGKNWDTFVPGPKHWSEVFRVLKPGAHLLVMSSTRTWDLASMAVRMAGFECRDTIACHGVPALAYTYGKGMPKSLDVSKAIDKAAGADREVIGTYRVGGNALTPTSVKGGTYGVGVPNSPSGELKITAPATADAKRFSGWGTALKPTFEVVLVFRKPLVGTVAQNVLEHGTGGINVDGCRVPGASPSVDRRMTARTTGNSPGHPGEYTDTINDRTSPERYMEDRPGEHDGRWPPNTVLCHSPECKKVGTKVVIDHPPGGDGNGGGKREPGFMDVGAPSGEGKPNGKTYVRPDGTEEVDAYDCVPDCPVAMMDRQSGQLASGKVTKSYTPIVEASSAAMGKKYRNLDPTKVYSDSGGASRFFPRFDWEPDELEAAFFYSGKASTRERNEGLPEGARNRHPTVKPLRLMQWMVRLVTPPGGVVLDCFAGSGTTGIAAHREGFRFLLVELEQESHEVALTRVSAAIGMSSGADVVDNEPQEHEPEAGGAA